MNDFNNTGEFLKSLRIAKGLTQMELAEHLNVSNKTVSKWESGVGIPEVTTLVILADFYDVTVDDILRGTKRVTKNSQKEANIANYLVSRVKEKYINFFIISLGIWLLSNITIIALGEITNNSSLGMGIGIILMLIGLVFQGINVNHFRVQIKDIDPSLKGNLINNVFHSTYLFFYLSFSTFVFAMFYNIGSNAVLTLQFVFFRFIYVYLLVLVSSIILYLIIRLFKISFLNKIKRNRYIFMGILFLIITVPLIVFTVIDPYDIAIKNENSYVSYSIYNKNDEPDRYYQLLFLSLLDNGEYSDADLIYDDITDEFTYIFDDGYTLVMSNEVFSFITSLEYVKYSINEKTATGYRVEASRGDMRNILYTQYTLPLISLYLVGILVYYLVSKRRIIKG